MISGRTRKVFHLEPDAPAGFDYILCESTYGDREREDATIKERRAALKREIVDALETGGNLLIPAFRGRAHPGAACTTSAC